MLQELIDGVERTMHRAIEEEENIPLETVTNFDEVSEKHRRNFLHRFFKTGGDIYFVYLYSTCRYMGLELEGILPRPGGVVGIAKLAGMIYYYPKGLVIVT